MKTITNIIYAAFALFALACFALSPRAHAQACPTYCDNEDNTAFGFQTLLLTTGTENTAFGAYGLYVDTTGSFNTASGSKALANVNTGNSNTAHGAYALLWIGTGSNNTAIGARSLQSNTTGGNNTATGFSALLNNTASNNTATGAYALQGSTTVSNNTGGDNTANGFEALLSNTTGGANTANGVDALAFNSTGSRNTANGTSALTQNTGGHDNTADGFDALGNNMAGSNNIALGSSAGSSLTNGSNNIDIGALGVAGEANKIRIGKQGTQNGAFIAGIAGVAISGNPVVVNASGKLGVAASSARFKEAIKPMDKASEAILALKPVTFRYKKELDPDKLPQFGLIAEEVEKVNPDLVARDEEGKIMSVRYEAVNAMLLNEFLKEHRKVERLEATVANLVTTVKEQAAQIQKVSAQLEMSKAAPQTVLNNQ